jgi:transposase-like protein
MQSFNPIEDLFKGRQLRPQIIILCTQVPTKITVDAYATSHRAVREMKESGELPGRVQVRSSQYLNNLVEQDHRSVQQRIRPMLGFKTIR